jgi:hypothetical protein
MYTTTYHKDQTVTIWNVYTQTWQRLRAKNVSDTLLATLTGTERARIRAMAMGINSKWQTVKEEPYTHSITSNDGAAAGGIVLVQRRLYKDCILERKIASNCGHTAKTPIYPI